MKNKLNPMAMALKTRMGGQSTPAFLAQKPRAKSKAPTIAPLRTPGAGSNEQSRAYGRAMDSAFKNTKTFGVLGAK